jgi:hypothetical protein
MTMNGVQYQMVLEKPPDALHRAAEDPSGSSRTVHPATRARCHGQAKGDGEDLQSHGLVRELY